MVKNNLEEFWTDNPKASSTQDPDNLNMDEEDTHLGDMPDPNSQSSYNGKSMNASFVAMSL